MIFKKIIKNILIICMSIFRNGIMNFDDNDIIEYFTVECSNIKLVINNKIYKTIGNEEIKKIGDMK